MIHKEYRGLNAIYQYISDINAALFGIADKSMLGPNELRHYLFWIIGYNNGIKTYSELIEFVADNLYDGRKNNIIYTIKGKLVKHGWMNVEEKKVNIPNQFKFEGKVYYSKKLELIEENAETNIKQEETNREAGRGKGDK